MPIDSRMNMIGVGEIGLSTTAGLAKAEACGRVEGRKTVSSELTVPEVFGRMTWSLNPFLLPRPHGEHRLGPFGLTESLAEGLDWGIAGA